LTLSEHFKNLNLSGKNYAITILTFELELLFHSLMCGLYIYCRMWYHRRRCIIVSGCMHCSRELKEIVDCSEIRQPIKRLPYCPGSGDYIIVWSGSVIGNLYVWWSVINHMILSNSYNMLKWVGLIAITKWLLSVRG